MKEERILLIVESPNKVKTLRQFLPKNYIIMASVGHICKIADSGVYNMGIDPKNNFKANYVISQDKKSVVEDLKEQVKFADKVIIASDPDREGEAIAYHLKNFLKIPDKKYERVTYHEITEKAVKEALSKPSKIDKNKAISAMTRARLDKIVGYRLSPIARKNIRALSVGRCQSAGLKLLVDRELEIQNFNPTTYFELFLHFKKNNNSYKAKYIGTEDKFCEKFSNLSDLELVCQECRNDTFKVLGIESKDRTQSPKLPFTTSTFQQEVSSKLGISIKDSMSCAQKLFEGIDINGQHIALITYIRTDSTEFAPEFNDELKNYIIHQFGKNYFSPIRKSKKKENVQDGHEAIRPVDLTMTPNKLRQFIHDEKLLKVYTIIYNRTLAAAMSPAIIGEIEYSIYNGKHKFLMISRELKFDGFKKVYNYKESNDDEEISLESFSIPEILTECELEEIQKVTKPPKRYSEATFVNTLDKLGIGRPSTYSAIVNVLLDSKRGYCILEDKLIVPTELGITLSKFLDQSFSDIININYTAELEKDLDLISSGELDDNAFLSDFYSKLEENIKKVAPQDLAIDEKCPQCGKQLIRRRGPYGEFFGCSGYPKCKYIKKI